MLTGPLVDYEREFVAQLPLIDRVAAFVVRRYRVSRDDADDFAAHVRLKLLEEDYAILRKYKGESSLRTYLTVVISRLWLDFRVSQWGKWRPSASARRLGPIAVRLEQLVTRDGLTFEEAAETLVTNNCVAAGRRELEQIWERLPARQQRRRFEPDDALKDVAITAPGPDAQLAAAERANAAAAVSSVLNGVLRELEPQDQLILALRFEDGRTVQEIAAILHVEAKPLYRRVERILRGLRQAFEAAGLDAAAVAELLQHPDASTDAGLPRGENADDGPSISTGARAWH